MEKSQKQNYSDFVDWEKIHGNSLQAFHMNTMQYSFSSVTSNLNEGKVDFIDTVRAEEMPSSEANQAVVHTTNVNAQMSLPQTLTSAHTLDAYHEEDDDDEAQKPDQPPMAVVKEEQQPQEEYEADEDVSTDSKMDEASHSTDAKSEQNDDEKPCGRQRVQTSFCEDPVGSTVKGIFFHNQHISEVQEVTSRESLLNPEMLINGRKKELDRW